MKWCGKNVFAFKFRDQADNWEQAYFVNTILHCNLPFAIVRLRVGYSRTIVTRVGTVGRRARSMVVRLRAWFYGDPSPPPLAVSHGEQYFSAWIL